MDDLDKMEAMARALKTLNDFGINIREVLKREVYYPNDLEDVLEAIGIEEGK